MFYRLHIEGMALEYPACCARPGDDGISHADPTTIAAARENPIGDAVGPAVADTLRPTEYLLDHGVRLKGGRGSFWLYRYESAEDFAFGEDRRKALAFTKAAAECTASILGKDWEAGRL